MSVGQALSRRPAIGAVVTREELRAKLQTYSREPFLELLSDMVGAQPLPNELRKWAARSPDRWAHAIEIFAKLGGFTEKREVTHSFIMNLMNMGDAEIQQTLHELEAEEGSFKEVSAQDISALPAPEPVQGVSVQKVSADWALLVQRPRGVPKTKKRGA